MEIARKPNVAEFFPFLGFLDLQGTRKEARLCMNKLFRVFQRFIDSKRSSNASRNNNGDMLDSLLDIAQEKESERDDNGIKHLLLLPFNISSLYRRQITTEIIKPTASGTSRTAGTSGMAHRRTSPYHRKSSSPVWRKLLKTQLFSRKCLKATKTVWSKKVKELITFIIESSEKGEAVEIARACFVTSLNVISNVVFSTDLGSYDPRASLELRDSLFRITEVMGKPNLANYFPSLGFLDLQGFRKEMEVCSERLFRVFQGLIDARIPERSLRTGPRDAFSSDLLDSLIDLIQEDGSEVDMNDINHFLYSILMIFWVNLKDLFIAGTETNSTTVEWAMVELLRNPEAMANARVEINFIVGPNRYVGDSDLLDFPYLQAVVTETLRLHPPSPFLIPRKTESETEVLGFLVPENAQILVNAWAIGRDPSVWENAERFEPERFLGRDIESIGKDFEMLPFGAGRRMCPGISLALRIVPHMLASLIYSFQWTLENEKSYPVPADLDMNETFGLTLHKTKPLYSDFVKKSYEYFY
ncbi:hypothetical protein EUTSA_v10005888mg [Eutrema salsugineum]|uniref:Cytochrome P450 n=1 Tax=Eutrema salsugineum TaxID=72664 RepID=V4L153_EUTSA|nr:hypothetical protein EUTSA_v10005888mg [Eutrema salsugineum]